VIGKKLDTSRLLMGIVIIERVAITITLQPVINWYMVSRKKMVDALFVISLSIRRHRNNVSNTAEKLSQ
jgi:hypothetical protein